VSIFNASEYFSVITFGNCSNFGCGGIEPFRSTIHRTPHYKATMKPQTMIFHLLDDMGLKKNMAAEHPDVVTRLAVLTEIVRNDLGDPGRRGVG